MGDGSTRRFFPATHRALLQVRSLQVSVQSRTGPSVQDDEAGRNLEGLRGVRSQWTVRTRSQTELLGEERLLEENAMLREDVQRMEQECVTLRTSMENARRALQRLLKAHTVMDRIACERMLEKVLGNHSTSSTPAVAENRDRERASASRPLVPTLKLTEDGKQMHRAREEPYRVTPRNPILTPRHAIMASSSPRPSSRPTPPPKPPSKPRLPERLLVRVTASSEDQLPPPPLSAARDESTSLQSLPMYKPPIRKEEVIDDTLVVLRSPTPRYTRGTDPDPAGPVLPLVPADSASNNHGHVGKTFRRLSSGSKLMVRPSSDFTWLEKEDAQEVTEDGQTEQNWFSYQSDTGHTYYYNIETQETTWTLPEGAIAFPGDSSADEVVVVGGDDGATGVVDWVECRTEDGCVYYYHPVTHESVWNLPTSSAGEEERHVFSPTLVDLQEEEEEQQQQQQQQQDSEEQEENRRDDQFSFSDPILPPPVLPLPPIPPSSGIEDVPTQSESDNSISGQGRVAHLRSLFVGSSTPSPLHDPSMVRSRLARMGALRAVGSTPPSEEIGFRSSS